MVNIKKRGLMSPLSLTNSLGRSCRGLGGGVGGCGGLVRFVWPSISLLIFKLLSIPGET